MQLSALQPSKSPMSKLRRGHLNKFYYWPRRVLRAIEVCIGLIFFLSLISMVFGGISGSNAGSYLIEFFLFILLVPITIALGAALTDAFLFEKLALRSIPPETRCRKCGYILKGITEPRCSECGEQI